MIVLFILQSSWTKKAAEVDSPQLLSPSCHLTDAPDSICAQVIHTKPESFSNGWVHVSETKDGHEQNEQRDDIAMGKDLEIGVSEDPEKLFTNQTRKRHSKLSEVDNRPFDNGQLQLDNESARGKWRDQAAGVISTNATNPLAEGSNFDAINGPSDISRVKVSGDCGEMPSLELTLKRLRGVEVGRSAANDDCNVLRHSDFSAFSKYDINLNALIYSCLVLLASNNGPKLLFFFYLFFPVVVELEYADTIPRLLQISISYLIMWLAVSSKLLMAPIGNAGSCSPLDNGSVAMKTETMQNFPSHANGPPLNQQSNGSSNNNDMASTAKYSTSKPEALNDKSESISAFKPFHSSAFQSLQNGRIYSSQQVLPEKADDMGVNTIQAQLRGTHHLVHIQNHQHHHRHYHQRDHNVQHYQSQQDQDDLSVKNMAAAAPQCGSSNVFEGTTETNVGNYSVNGSASGSNHGSNGQNGSSTGLNAGITNLESDNGAAGKSGVSGNIVDEERAAQREAALMKFRQKRKERCFGKRVRYHSRKKLAEQRPRVRGQFVRQTVSDSKAGKDYSSNDLTSDDNSGDNLR
ncbi:hypothetical protein Pint_32263 [Pistacia integerrima]|uniref:Uncharacterized protein n=1 Tax=Pistacia integerrima TaxID=434235 RepID=A0ACC0XTQ4_9ROSI|nr:hypothetical protein Pint_32263 [Pistacia integerrima]